MEKNTSSNCHNHNTFEVCRNYLPSLVTRPLFWAAWQDYYLPTAVKSIMVVNYNFHNIRNAIHTHFQTFMILFNTFVFVIWLPSWFYYMLTVDILTTALLSGRTLAHQTHEFISATLPSLTPSLVWRDTYEYYNITSHSNTMWDICKVIKIL